MFECLCPNMGNRYNQYLFISFYVLIVIDYMPRMLLTINEELLNKLKKEAADRHMKKTQVVYDILSRYFNEKNKIK